MVTKEDVWLRVYTVSLSLMMHGGISIDVARRFASETAAQAVQEFLKAIQ
jgi:hypothetical protein